MDKVADDICLNAQDMFEGASGISLNGLKSTKMKALCIQWEKRKEGYIPDLKLPTISRNY